MAITASQNLFECSPATPARFIGEFASLSALETAHPTAPAGSYAVVNAEGADLIYYYSVSDGGWFTQSSDSSETPTLPQVLAQGDRTIRLTDGDGETHLELDDRGKLVFNAEADFLYLTTGIFPVNSVLKIYNAGAIDLFGLLTGDYWGIAINGNFIDEFTGITLKPGTAILKKLEDGDGSMEQWLLTYEISEFSKEALGLGDVDNTSDLNKPVSTAQAAAISLASSNAINQSVAQSRAIITSYYQTAPAKIAIDTNVSALSGAITAQGVSAGITDVILLMAQTDPKENGLWLIASGSGGSTPWIRPPYYNADVWINRSVIQVYDGDYSGREYKSIGTVGTNITITEITDSKLKPGIGSDTKSSMSQKAISDELALKADKSKTRQIIRSKNNGTFGSHTGNTAETVLFSIPITGGEFEIGDWMDFMFQFERLVTGTNIAVRLRAGINGNTSDALISTLVLTSATLEAAIKRERFEFNTGNILKGVSNSFSTSQIDIALIVAARTSTSLNPANNWNLTVAAALGSGSDTVLCTGYQIGKTKTF